MTPEQPTPWPEMPVETEIYILPNGEVVIADLPAELAARFAPLRYSGYEIECIEICNETKADETEVGNVADHTNLPHTQ